MTAPTDLLRGRVFGVIRRREERQPRRVAHSLDLRDRPPLVVEVFGIPRRHRRVPQPPCRGEPPMRGEPQRVCSVAATGIERAPRTKAADLGDQMRVSVNGAQLYPGARARSSTRAAPERLIVGEEPAAPSGANQVPHVCGNSRIQAVQGGRKLHETVQARVSKKGPCRFRLLGGAMPRHGAISFMGSRTRAHHAARGPGTPGVSGHDPAVRP